MDRMLILQSKVLCSKVFLNFKVTKSEFTCIYYVITHYIIIDQ